MNRCYASARVYFSLAQSMYYRLGRKGRRIYEPGATFYYAIHPWRITANYKFAERTL